MGNPHYEIDVSERILSPGRVEGPLVGTVAGRRNTSKPNIIFQCHAEYNHIRIANVGKVPMCHHGGYLKEAWFSIPEITARIPTIDLIRELYSRIRSKKHLQSVKVLLDKMSSTTNNKPFLAFLEKIMINAE